MNGPGARLTAAAERAGQRYTLLLTGFEGIFARYAAHDNPGSAMIRRKAMEEAYSLAFPYIDREVKEIADIISRERDNAFHATINGVTKTSYAIPEQLVDHATAIAADLEQNLRTQLERDIAAIGKGLRNIDLRVSLIRGARSVSRPDALGMVRRAGDAQVRFQYTDRAQRNWPSAKLVRTLYRHALVLTWNESALLAMALWGFPGAIIRHPDAAHGDSGTVISLGEDLPGVTWEQVREDVFHPNSNAWVEPYLGAPDK